MFPPATASPATTTAFPMIGRTQAVSLTSDAQYLELHKQCKKESMESRWVWERQWTRAIHYINQRQWLAPYSRRDGWRDARLARGIPRPTTSLPKQGIQSLRAMFTAIKFGVTVKPTSQDPKAIITAATADDAAPLLHDLHGMNGVLSEGDFWFLATGNVFYHSFWDYNAPAGVVEIPYERCIGCSLELMSDQIAESGQKCPACGGMSFIPVLQPNGEPRVEKKSQGCGVTVPLSPLEIAFPLSYPRWSAVPYVTRLRWRTKRECEEHPELSELVQKINWKQHASERSLQIFQSLPFQNDVSNARWDGGVASLESEEGIPEYQTWFRPSPQHPEGLVMSVLGDSNEIVVHSESEGLPGPIPYRDVKDRPIFTFTHAAFEHVGGRVLGSGILDPVIPKIDALNRHDSLIEMIIMRMASPQWAVPKNADVQWLGDSPGLPGLILQWNAQIAGAAGRPERVPGIGPDPSIIQQREALRAEIEDAMGTSDILKGIKPTGIEAFSALQLMLERAMSRHTFAFQSRGDAYKMWFTWALELERQFGPDDRIHAVMTPTRGWAFKTFKKSQLTGDYTVIVEDGTLTPKTSLGERAALTQLNALQALDMKDPEQVFVVYQKFGLTSLAPGIDAQMQSALKKQERFEQWVLNGGTTTTAQMMPDQAMAFMQSPQYPLKWRRYWEPEIHRTQWLKWCNGDAAEQLFAEHPEAEGLAEAHLLEIDLALAEKMMGEMSPDAVPNPPNGGQGGGRAMANSNQNSGSVASMPGGPSMQGAQAPA